MSSVGEKECRHAEGQYGTLRLTTSHTHTYYDSYYDDRIDLYVRAALPYWYELLLPLTQDYGRYDPAIPIL